MVARPVFGGALSRHPSAPRLRSSGGQHTANITSQATPRGSTLQPNWGKGQNRMDGGMLTQVGWFILGKEENECSKT